MNLTIQTACPHPAGGDRRVPALRQSSGCPRGGAEDVWPGQEHRPRNHERYTVQTGEVSSVCTAEEVIIVYLLGHKVIVNGETIKNIDQDTMKNILYKLEKCRLFVQLKR